jgi:transcriptional regulator with XRE-family HTH domain
MSNLTLGQKIKQFRTRAGMTQLELELAIEASQGSISRVENNQINPTKETLLKIIDTLNLNTREAASLFGLDFGKELLKFLEIDGKLAKVDNTKDIFDIVMHELKNFLDIKYASFFMLDEFNNRLVLEAYHVPRLVIDFVNKFIPDPESISFNIFKDRILNNDIVLSLRDQKIIVSKFFYAICRPLMNEAFAKTLERFLAMKLAIHIPLVYKGKKLAVLGFIWPYDELSDEDLKILETLGQKVSRELYYLLSNKQSE